MEKKLYYTGIWAYVVLLVLAVVFYKERTILLDNSFFLFELLRTDDFTIQRHRFISAVPQIATLLASGLSLSLKGVLIGYSLGLIIYHFACYLLTGLVLKNYKLGIAQLLVHVLIVTHTFFWGLSELLLGISLIFPFFALIIDNEQKLPKLLYYPLLLAVLVSIAFSHPLIVFPFLFAAAYIWLSREMVINRRILVVSAIVFTCIFGYKVVFLSDAYEASSVSTLGNFKKLFPNYLSQYSNIHFVENWLNIYYWLPLSLIVICVVYIRDKSWLKMLLVLGAFAGYSQVVNISYPGTDIHEFYMENMYVVLCVILAFPLVYDVLPKTNKTLATLCFVLVLLTSFYRIYHQQEFYSNRIGWLRTYMDKYKDEKMLVAMGDKPRAILLMPWATPYEFWLLSTLERNKTVSITIHDNVDEISWAWGNDKAFVPTWGVYPYKELNPRYFKFTDTTHYYGVYKDR